MGLLPKPQGGQRTVAKTPSLYRLWNVIQSPEMRKWSGESAPEWDFASQGRSAAFSATLRAWTNEVATLSGLACATVLWDMETFFDTIHPREVLKQGIHFGYPPRLLLLALSMHAALRVLTIRGVASNVLVV